MTFSITQETIKKLNDYKFEELNKNFIFECLDDRYRWPFVYLNYNQPTVEIISLDRHEFYCNDGYINSDKIKSIYDIGFTLIISRVQTLTSEIRKFSSIIEKDFGKEININLYMSKGKKEVSFPSHDHHYDVVVKNIQGKSTWICNNEKTILEEQNILLIEKYKMHQVISIENSKMSLTCNLN
jgi:mannose-6-phosphate isomerase-like protein (cupin superfamily)